MQPMKPMQFPDLARWWPKEFGIPTSSGAQNAQEYAYFRSLRRLLMRYAGGIEVYDTGEHQIVGIAQISDTQNPQFETSSGSVSLKQLRLL
jgi:hypothetical protein